MSEVHEHRGSVCRVWNFQDGKPGHENQAAGLLQALARLVTLQVEDKKPFGFLQLVKCLLGGRPCSALPDIVIGTGHATHLSVLAAARCCDAKSIVIMKPSLPLAWFDLCFVPEHDRVKAGAQCVLTKGVFNRISFHARPAPGKQQTGLILLGGVSRHYAWNSAVVAAQIEEIVLGDARPWIVAGSRRTPADFPASLPAEVGRRVRFVAAGQTGRDWLPEQLARCNPVWVTEDSVSMVYEALSSGAACGLLKVVQGSEQDRPDNKLAAGIERLVAEEYIVPFTRWRQGVALQPPREPFNEAERCARIVYQRWLKKN